MKDLPVIQRTYDLILWYVPLISKFPKDHKFVLGDRVQNTLYALLEGFIRARYSREKAVLLETLNAELDVLRHQTRLCKDLGLMGTRRYEYVSGLINEIGQSLGGWIRQQKGRSR